MRVACLVGQGVTAARCKGRPMRSSPKSEHPTIPERNPEMSIHRSAITRYAARAAIVAGAVALSTAGASSAFAAQSDAHPNGFAPTEECLNWTGTIQSFPGLTKVAHSVTAVVSGTLSNCNFDGTPQSFSGTFFGTLTGSAERESRHAERQRRRQLAPGCGLEPDHLAGQHQRLVEGLLVVRHDQQRRRHGRAARGQLRRRLEVDDQRRHLAEPRQHGPVRHLRQRRLSTTPTVPPA